jgi:hypothetical protein
MAVLSRFHGDLEQSPKRLCFSNIFSQPMPNRGRFGD